MMRAREARISSSWRLRSVTSTPERRTSDVSRPVTSSIGVARPGDHDVLVVRLPPARLSLDARDAVRRGCDRHPREVAVVRVDQLEHARVHDLLVGPPERLPERLVDPGPVRRRRRRRRSRPPRSTTTTMLGIACISVLVMSRSRCSCTSRCLRSVTSRPLTRRTASVVDRRAGGSRTRAPTAVARSSSPTCCRGRRPSRRPRRGRSAPARIAASSGAT